MLIDLVGVLEVEGKTTVGVTFVGSVEVDGFAMIETVLVGIGIVVALRTIGDVLRGS